MNDQEVEGVIAPKINAPGRIRRDQLDRQGDLRIGNHLGQVSPHEGNPGVGPVLHHQALRSLVSHLFRDLHDAGASIPAAPPAVEEALFRELILGRVIRRFKTCRVNDREIVGSEYGKTGNNEARGKNCRFNRELG